MHLVYTCQRGDAGGTSEAQQVSEVPCQVLAVLGQPCLHLTLVFEVGHESASAGKAQCHQQLWGSCLSEVPDNIQAKQVLAVLGIAADHQLNK